MSNKIVAVSNPDTKRLSDAVEFDFDEFEIVELENREEFMPLAYCDGGGGGGQPGGVYNGGNGTSGGKRC